MSTICVWSRLAVVGALATFSLMALAKGIVADVVNSPLSATGLVKDARVGINVLLQTEQSPGIEFMDPDVVGYGIPAGGRIEIELARGFERDASIPLSEKTIMLVTGAPQQGMPGDKVGYTIREGANPNTYTITPTDPNGLAAENLMSPAPSAKDDPVRQRGIKVFHIGLFESPFTNRGDSGQIEVRFIDASGKAVHQGNAHVDFLTEPVSQVQPNNLPDKNRNHNWQVVNSGDTLGKTPGTLPIPVMLYAKADGVAPENMVKFKQGLIGAGVLSTQQLAAMEYKKPDELSRYNGGLIVQDSNGDGILEPGSDRIVGGVIGKAPSGAKGQELRSLDVHGAVDLAKPTSAYHPKLGKAFGGAVMLLEFTAGDKPGKYRPTLALLRDPANLSSGDGSAYTFTIVVK